MELFELFFFTGLADTALGFPQISLDSALNYNHKK